MSGALSRLRVSLHMLCTVVSLKTRETFTMAKQLASQELLATPLPDLVKNLGLAVAEANRALRNGDEEMRYTIPSATVKLKVAISIDSSEELQAGGGAKIGVVTVNASYAKTFGFKEEASSEIELTLAAVPLASGTPAGGG